VEMSSSCCSSLDQPSVERGRQFSPLGKRQSAQSRT
jgi:hypothetical protein